MSELVEVSPEYVYITIPADYICIYHKILIMLADYGEDMLKDCKAACKDRNSDAIDCYNMFNAAVAARKLGKDKLAETIIKYVDAKIKQIYRGDDNANSLVYPIDKDGHVRAIISCGEHPTFKVDTESGKLYEEYMDALRRNMSETFDIEDKNLIVDKDESDY